MPKTTVNGTTPAPRWATKEEVADYLGVSQLTVRRRIADGTIPARRLGPRLIRIDLNELDAAMRPIPTAGGAA